MSRLGDMLLRANNSTRLKYAEAEAGHLWGLNLRPMPQCELHRISSTRGWYDLLRAISNYPADSNMLQNTAFDVNVKALVRHQAPALSAIALALFGQVSPASADVLLQSDFSESNWFSKWQDNTNKMPLKGEPPRTNRVPADTSTAGFVPLDGPALQVVIPQGENMGTGLSFFPRTILGKDPSELYLRYHLRFGSDWNQAQNGKLPGFGGTYDIGGWGGKPSTGTNGWSARAKFGDPCSNGKIEIASYVYHADMTGTYGQGVKWTDGCNGGLNKNQWYVIDYYVKVNTPGQSNGILRGWIDGKPVMEKTGLRFDDTGDFQIERVWMNVYHGGKIVAPQDMHLFIDSVVVSQEPIGSDSTANESSTPQPPTQFSVE